LSNLKDEGWTLFNPTIINYNNGYLVLVRSSNYYINQHGQYIIPDCDNNIIKTKYIQLILDSNLNALEEKKVTLDDYAKTNYPVDGLEDLRIFKVKDCYYVSGTIRNAAPYDGTCRIGLAVYDPIESTIGSIKVINLNNGSHEKNWMPIECQDEIKWLYHTRSNKQTLSLKLNEESKEMISSSCEFPAADNFRGGSQLIKIENNYYSIIHEAADLDRKRIYTHRIVEWDENFKIIRFSKSFFLKESRAIEFCAGMCFNNNQVHIAFGAKDKEAYLASLSLDQFKAILSL
jgi:predicted GH43/DUF377 family glycosyl hydrolase